MKVLHLFNEINFSGAEIMYANAASLFQSKGIQMLAFSTGKNYGNFVEQFEKNNIKTYHKPISSSKIISPSTILYYFRFYKFLKREKITVLHIHRNDLYMVALCSKIAGVRTIKTMHNVFKNRRATYFFGYLQRTIARNFLKVVSQSIGKSVYENELFYYKNPTILINNWYDFRRFYKAKDDYERKLGRNKLKIKEGAFVIISIGNCTEIKNHSDIIRALSIVNKKFDCIYLHLGTGACEVSERKIAVEMGLEKSIRFFGNQIDVRDYLIASDIYIMPSKFEGLSISCIEAMACGLPSILYNSPGLRDMITNDDNGFLIEPDYNLLADKIIQFQQNPALIMEKGNNANKHVLLHYFLSKNVDEIIKLYHNE